jgi:hypothetical protein
LKNTWGESWLFTTIALAQVASDVSNLIRIQVDACKAHAQEAVKTALDLESTPHYTQNTHYLQTLRGKWLAHYKVVRSKPTQYQSRNQAAKVTELGGNHVFGFGKAVEAHPSCISSEEGEERSPRKTPKGRKHHVREAGEPIPPKYLSSELEQPPPLMVETPAAKALRALAEAGYPNLQASDLSRLLPPDSFEEELIVMAEVRAYYHVAYKVSCAR